MSYTLHYPDESTHASAFAHMRTARNTASKCAELSNLPVLVKRNGTPSLLALPDGSFPRPPGTVPMNEREDCKAATGERCYCSPCRARRRG
jgi:hypothetical protein